MFCVSETYIMIMTPIIAVYLCQQRILFGYTYSDVSSEQESKVGLLCISSLCF